MLVSRSAVALIVFSSCLLTDAHSWIDCIDRDPDVVYADSYRWIYGSTSGHGLCEGYARNYPGRGATDINDRYVMKIDHKKVAEGVPVCQFGPGEANYRGWRTKGQARPGEKLYFAYLPNGHISKDKRARTTQYGIYWSGDPGKELRSTSDMNPSNLLVLEDFDDGNCGETYEDGDYSGGTILSGRAGDGKPCVGSFTIPQSTANGVYQFVWFWSS